MRAFLDRSARDGSPNIGTHSKGMCRTLARLACACAVAALLASLPSGPWVLAADSSDEPVQGGAGNDTAVQVPALRGDELDQLARDLGHAERAKRERAYQQFLDSGPDALRSLLTRRQDDNPEWVRMANQLLAAIQDKHGIRPTRFDGLEFLPFVDPVWRIPPPGGHTPINLGVNVTNLRDEPFRFFMKRTISPHFGGFGVPPLQGGGGGDNIDRRTDYWSPPLAKGQSVTVSDFEAKLCWSADGKELRLRGKTDACTFFGYGPLKPGRYYLWFTCDCTYERWGQPVAILFDGADIPLTRSRQTSTQFITFEIK